MQTTDCGTTSAHTAIAQRACSRSRCWSCATASHSPMIWSPPGEAELDTIADVLTVDAGWSCSFW